MTLQCALYQEQFSETSADFTGDVKDEKLLPTHCPVPV